MLKYIILYYQYYVDIFQLVAHVHISNFELRMVLGAQKWLG